MKEMQKAKSAEAKPCEAKLDDTELGDTRFGDWEQEMNEKESVMLLIETGGRIWN